MPKAIPRGIDYFPILVAQILGLLYTSFPTPIDLSADALNLAEVDPDEDAGRLAEIWADTVRWLNAEGFIRLEGKSDQQDTFHRAILTSKGISSLNTAASPAGGTSIADHLAVALSDIDREENRAAITNCIENLISEAK